jgi:hypothetical protein
MNEEFKNRGPLIRPGDRFLLLLLCVIFVVGFGATYYAINLWQPNDTFERVVKFLLHELNMTLLFFTVLVAIRCLITSPQLEKKLASTALKVIIGMTLVCCAVTALILLALLGQL